MDALQTAHASAKPRILLFGGTSEGRLIAEWLSARGSCDVVASSLTEYGALLVDELPNVTSLAGRMVPDDMRALMEAGGFACVVDATHPYAVDVSASIAECAAACGLPRYRVSREGEPKGPWTGVDTAQEAAELVAARPGNVLLTTGSRDLSHYVRAMPDFADRLYVRILPVEASLASAAALGIPTDHIIAMQGPFSKELNCALIRESAIDVLVTKASGAAGGFWEKAEAAQECGIELIVIHRPPEERGLGVPELERELEKVLAI